MNLGWNFQINDDPSNQILMHTQKIEYKKLPINTSQDILGWHDHHRYLSQNWWFLLEK